MSILARRPTPIRSHRLVALAFCCLISRPAQAAVGDTVIPGLPETPTYVVQRIPSPVKVDGKLDDDTWRLAPRIGPWRWLDTGEAADRATYGQMAWDNEYLYFAFSTEDPDIWATMLLRDEPVFVEEDFEIFLDPDGDEYHYYEWQINPLGTLYDVVWRWPDHTPGPGNRGNHAFDLEPMLTGYQVRGTVWERADVDTGWTAEVALSWAGLSHLPGRFRSPPRAGDTWRIGFSRVESPRPPLWQADWTWPIHGEYNMHIGRRDARVQFSDAPLGGPAPGFLPVPRLEVLGLRLEPEAAGGGIEPGRPVSLFLQIGNDGAPVTQATARLACIDSLVIVLDSVAVIGRVPSEGECWSEDGFSVRLSRAVEPGRALVFQVALQDDDGRWTGDACFAFAAGRAWRTASQIREGVQQLLATAEGLWGISRSNVWRWDQTGQVRGFYQPDDGLPRHARQLLEDGRGRIWAAGERGIACFEGERWRDLTGQQGLPPRDFDQLATGPRGEVWIAARSGLFRFTDTAEPVWTAAEGYAPGKVRDLLVDRNGAAWVVGDSLLYLAAPDDHRVLGARHGLPSNRLTAVVEDTAGRIWVAGLPTGPTYRDGGVACRERGSWRSWRRGDGLVQNAVTALAVDRGNRVWAGHPDGSLSVFDGQAWDRWPAGSGKGTGPACGSWTGGPGTFMHDDRGRVWLVGNDGLAEYDGRIWQTWTWQNGLFGGPAAAIAQGPDGRVWVGDARSLSWLGE